MIAAAVHEVEHYLNAGYGLQSWLLTRDHKRVAVLYFITISVFFAIGGVLAGLMRIELLTPRGALVNSDTYNRLFTMHGVIMVFFFLIPSVPATLGNFLLPIMIGARGFAFPRVNLLSWYLLMLGGGFALYALVAGGVDTGWTLYPPYSTASSGTYVVATVICIIAASLSSMLTGLNFIVTVHRGRAPGMTWSRLPIFVWANYITGVVQLLATPVIGFALVLLIGERAFQLHSFDSTRGGDPVLFQRLFWFYAQPAVYMMVLPAVGVVCELISTFSRKRVSGYRVVVISTVAAAALSFFTWGQHLSVGAESPYVGLGFSLLSYIAAIPAAILLFNWIATLYKGSISFAAPMLYAFGFIGLFTAGGLAGLFLAAPAINIQFGGTYFAVAHFHYLVAGCTMMAYLGGLHYWWPKITGRMYPEGWARLSALLIFLGVNSTFFPQFILGYLGMPSRYHTYPDAFQVLQAASALGGIVLGLGCVLPGIYLIWSLCFGPIAGANPWRASGLEWQTGSPPPPGNFDEIRVVTREPYDYRSVVRDGVDIDP